MRYSLYGIRGQEQRLLQRAGWGGSGENAERNGRGDSGGGIFVNQDGTLTVSNSTFSGNSANDHGGGIRNAGALTVSNSTFSGNNAALNGGGIYMRYGAAQVSSSTFSGNSATNGRVIYNYNNEGTVTTLQNIIVANSPTGSNCSGTITNGGREPQLSRYGLPRHQRRSQTRVFAG